MVNLSRLGIQSTKALAKIAKKILDDLKKSSDKTKLAKKNIKNAEKLNVLVEDILDPVAEEGITGAAANKIYREMLDLDLKLSKDPTLKRKKVEPKDVGGTLDYTLEDLQKIIDDPELSKDDAIKNPLLLLLEKKIRGRQQSEYEKHIDLYGGEPTYMDLKEGDLARQPSLKALGEGKIAKSMENVALPTDEQAKNVLLGRATLAVNNLLKKKPEYGKQYSREYLIQKWYEKYGYVGQEGINKFKEEAVEILPTTTNIKDLKWYQIPEIKTFVNQIIKDKPDLLNTLTPEEIAAPLLREYKVPKRRQSVGYMKFPGSTKKQPSSIIQTMPGAGMQRDPLGGGYLGDKVGDRFVRGQFATSENIPTVDGIPLGPRQYKSGIAYKPKEIMLQPDDPFKAIPGIKRYRPPERFGPANTEEIIQSLLKMKSRNYTEAEARAMVNKLSRVGTIKGQEKNIPLEGDIPMDVGPMEMEAARELAEGLDERAFTRMQAGDAERMGVEPITLRAIEGERSLTGKPFSMGDRGPMPWTVVTPDDVAKLTPEDKILYKRNSDQFFQLVEYFKREQGLSPRDAIAEAKRYMLGEISETAATARTLMTKTFDDVGDKVRQERTASMLAPEDAGGTKFGESTLEDALPDDILDQLGKIEYKKGGKVKAKKKAKFIPKIIKNRSIRGKKKTSKPLGVGAAQRGWGAVRSA